MQAYPLLPLRGVHVFPEMVVPLEVGREKSVRALEAAMEGDQRLVFVSQRDARMDEPTVDDLFDVGTLAKVQQLVRVPGGGAKVIVQGLARCRVIEFREVEPFFLAQAEEVPEDTTPLGDEGQAWVLAVVHLYEEYMKISRKMSPETLMTISADDPGRLCDAVITHLDLKTQDKQRVLEAFTVEERLRTVHDILSHQLRLMTLERDIAGRVRRELEAGQREFFLRAQLKAIQEELGEGEPEGGEIGRYRQLLEERALPPTVKERAEQEIGRLERMQALSPEAGVVRTYLDWIFALPFTQMTEDHLSIRDARRVLDEDHSGLEQVKERILEYLAVRALASSLRGPILCLVGPPGVGKTSLGESIARALDRRFVRASLGGIRDEAEIRGHRRTYVGSLPGRILHAMRQAGTRNPVFLLDEVDKLGADFRGDPASALLEVLDPEQNHAFSDHYLELPFDLSQVLFLTTANHTASIPRPLLDRMEIVNLPGYSEDEKCRIAREHLIPKVTKEHGLPSGSFQISDRALERVVVGYTREAGVRQLERALATIARKLARNLAESGHAPSRVTVRQLNRHLGRERFRVGAMENEDQVGVATAVYTSEVGGDTMPVEVSLVPGRGRLILTGKLGDVMQESARAAFTYLRAHAATWSLGSERMAGWDVHVHVPDGATPKEGPSAGITIATAMVSAFTGRAVRRSVAMTGEVTLRGRVLPVGGLRDKMLAVRRAGLRVFLYPKANEPEVLDLPSSARRGVELVPVAHMDAVIARALLPDRVVPALPAPRKTTASSAAIQWQ